MPEIYFAAAGGATCKMLSQDQINKTTADASWQMQHLPQPPECQLFTPIRGQARCACVIAAGEWRGLMFGGCAVPTVIINSGSTGHRVGAVNFKVPRWLSSLNQNVDRTGSLPVVAACKDWNQRISVQRSTESRATSQKRYAYYVRGREEFTGF